MGQQMVPRLAEAQQDAAQHRPGGEIERTRDLAAQQAVGGPAAVGGGEGVEVDPGEEAAGKVGLDALHWPSVDLGQAGAQGFVAVQEEIESPAQAAPVDRAELEEDRHVVGRAARAEAVERPEPLLGEGERRPVAMRRGDQGRGLEAAVAGFGEASGEASQGGMLEDLAHLELDAEHLAQPRGDLGGEQGMAAEGEKILLAADLSCLP